MHSSPKCHSISIMLRLHDPLWAKLMAARLFLEYFGIQINSWSRACKISPSHHPSSAVLDNRYELFVLICCVLISPDSAVHHGQTSLLYSHLSKGHCSRNLVVCSDLVLQTCAVLRCSFLREEASLCNPPIQHPEQVTSVL